MYRNLYTCVCVHACMCVCAVGSKVQTQTHRDTHTHIHLHLVTIIHTDSAAWMWMVGVVRGAHPTACAHYRALDTPAASPRSWLQSTPDTARRRPAAPCRLCSCRRAHSSLHGAGRLRAGSPRTRRPNGGGLMRSRTCGFRGRRNCREVHYVLCLLAANFAEESLAVRKLGFATLDVGHHSAWHLGVAYDTERDQRHEERGAAPAANMRLVRSSDGRITELLRRADA